MAKANNKGLLFGLLQLGYILTAFAVILNVITMVKYQETQAIGRLLFNFFILSVAFFLIRIDKNIILSLIGYAYIIVTDVTSIIRPEFFNELKILFQNIGMIFESIGHGEFFLLTNLISYVTTILMSVVSVLSVIKLILNKRK